MTRIGFIGLGIMGGPMAAHLVAAGHDVTGFDLSSAALDTAGRGRAARRRPSARTRSRGAEVVITMLPNHPQVEEVVLGTAACSTSHEPGTLLIDMSTIRPDDVGRRRAAGASAASACSTRRCQRRRDGRDRRRPLASWSAATRPTSPPPGRSSRSLGKTIVHVGPHGAGQIGEGRQPARGRRHLRAGRRGDRAAGGVRRGRRRRAWTCSPAGWPAAGSSTSSGSR